MDARLKKIESKINEEESIELNHTNESKGMGSERSSRHRKESSGGGPTPSGEDPRASIDTGSSNGLTYERSF